MTERKEIQEFDRIFRALGDSHRLHILDMLMEREMNAGEILEAVDVVQSTLSHHMKSLCEAGLVNARREGKWTYYTVNEEAVKLAEDFLQRYIAEAAVANENGKTKGNTAGSAKEKAAGRAAGSVKEKAAGNTANSVKEKPAGRAANSAKEKAAGNAANSAKEKPAGNTANSAKEKAAENTPEPTAEKNAGTAQKASIRKKAKASAGKAQEENTAASDKIQRIKELAWEEETEASNVPLYAGMRDSKKKKSEKSSDKKEKKLKDEKKGKDEKKLKDGKKLKKSGKKKENKK
ncbi:MAG: metalloregulator ArsR/SmtB family transcription factor [Lachnospiraceae bacterium]|nr:metalloregulator ArsR/SmtB family transcription factor [Lachnospiraceae bacterium]MDD3795151.1 metalloregulator ArsR/SmtB family transcription factor [Lachnospiraceae bacterium]